MEGKGSEMRGLLPSTRFCGEKDTRLRLRMRLGEAVDEGVSDLIGVRGAVVVISVAGDEESATSGVEILPRRNTVFRGGTRQSAL